MARKIDIQYVNFYTAGSAARKLELYTPEKKTAVNTPKSRPQKRFRTISIDPLAISGVVVAAVMLVLMVVGLVRLNAVQNEQIQLEQYVQSLQEQNGQLQDTYENGYDLEQIERDALALGMVPAEDANHITIRVDEPAVMVEENDAWTDFFAFLTSLFA